VFFQFFENHESKSKCRKTNGPFTIIPILVGSLSFSKELKYAKLLLPYASQPNTLFVISSDFCHWGSRFNYTPKADPTSNIPIHKHIETLDREGMTLIEECNASGFADYLKRTRNTICGRHPIGVLLHLFELLKESLTCTSPDKKRKTPFAESDIKFTHYEQSSKVVKDTESSVSYAAGRAHIFDSKQNT
jgi:MEMO1 family protein